ncbi:ABC transporter permease, partial [Kingella kingae]
GLMKTTEQLEAMKVMAVNPVARVVAPRFWAGFLSMPLLASIFNVAGIAGAYLIGVQWLGLDAGIFWSNMQNGITLSYDVVNGLIKSLCFGVAVSLISVYQGFHCVPTAEGILRASTRTVVASSLTVLALDFVLTAFMFTA